MRIVHCVPDLQPESGGLPRSILRLAECTSHLGAKVHLLTNECGPEASRPLSTAGAGVPMTLLPFQGRFRSRYRFHPNYGKVLRDLCADKTELIIHASGVWLPLNHTASRIAASAGIPLITSVHGMLRPWALRFRGWKKSVAWYLYQKRDLQQAQVLHVSSSREADELRRLGLRRPLVVLPFAVDPPMGMRRAETWPRTVLFLSRIHPVKGLVDLIEAWRLARPSGWRVVVAGSDAGRSATAVKEMIGTAGLDGDFQYVGQVTDEKKWDLFARASLFVLPSRSESFGSVIGEALAAAVPVITTVATPWEDLKKHGCGWWIEVGIDPLTEALRNATALTDEERLEMGIRGRKLIESKYSWPRVAEEMHSVYRWMLGGPEPASLARAAS